MARCLFVVENVARIIGRGIVLTPGLSYEEHQNFQVGDSIVLQKPDGTGLTMAIDGFEFPIPNPTRVVWILLKFTEDRFAVPIGTKVWTSDLHSMTGKDLSKYNLEQLKICPQCGQEMIPDLILKDGRGVTSSPAKSESPDMIAGYGFFCTLCQRGWTGDELHHMGKESD